MFLKELGSLGWSFLVGGGVSVMAAGGYGAISFLGNDRTPQERHRTIRDWFENNVKNNDLITSAEYISKNEGNGGKPICGRWVNGKAEVLEAKKCEELIKQKWEKSSISQPEVWFEANEQSIEHAITSYFDNGQAHYATVSKISNGWKYGGIECLKVEPKLTGQNIQVNCNY
ncbi:hypothetical protein [Mycoplasma suis]|uniref:Uncharacterized protein n=1 Tax=Mycoplasma suis (strain Illinois) TaxID=768700 RepID=F0QQJ9_MYCSL|nr:hypothetical protein [Mycoplasma suis]ADX97769.1 hypothetical protein MSU_0225 [Mycoplasma suis str. Illinois]